jgi:UDP-4-amino-4,6-dideoxy-N-acetyl-beta-L-altrosamine transaminase
MTNKFLPYGQQLIDQADIDAVTEVLRSDFLTTGPAVDAFEQLLASKTGAKHAISCNSGTAALHMAAYAIGLKTGDAVIVPTITFLASANAMTFTGATVVFADCDPTNGLMQLEHLEAAITHAKRAGLKPKAVVPVHLAGQVCQMDELASIARRENMYVIEDACHAIGSKYGKELEYVAGDCTHSDLAVFSFHPVKTIAMGEGGAVTTNSEEFAARLATFRNHGMSRFPDDFSAPELGKDSSGEWGRWYYEMKEPGYNYRACDIQCALGKSQLLKLEQFADIRRSLREHYYTLEKELPNGINLTSPSAECSPCPHLMIALFDNDFLGNGRNHVMEHLRTRGIGTQVHYIPVHLQPYYRRKTPELSLPGAESFYQRCLSLPLYASMTTSDVDTVVAALKELP